MFTIDSEARVIARPKEQIAVDQSQGKEPFFDASMLSDILYRHPGEWAVKLWNQLPGVTPIHTPPGEPTAKFRNKQTAIDRIWAKLCELYPDAVNSEDMPKKRNPNAKAAKASTNPRILPKGPSASHSRRNQGTATRNGNGRKSRWAEELTEALRKQFNPGDSFELQDVYKMIPQFQRRHPENKHIAARLRATLAQDLRGSGIVKSSAKGKYKLAAA